MAYGIDYRRRVISFVQEGGSKLEAARLFKVHPDTIYEWLKRGEDLSPRPSMTRKRKLDKVSLRRDVKDRPDALLKERAAKYGVHESSMSRALRKLKIVKKTA